MAKTSPSDYLSELGILGGQILELAKLRPRKAREIIHVLRESGWDLVSIKLAFEMLLWDNRIGMIWEAQMKPSECECGNAQDAIIEQNGLKYWFHWCEIVKCWVYQLIPGQQI